uniref:Uncharacterized protein n=1 Tax=Anguilla anguilla TaxID=7936 RepID=A0A0E9TZP5_ANGAN
MQMFRRHLVLLGNNRGNLQSLKLKYTDI